MQLIEHIASVVDGGRQHIDQLPIAVQR